LDALATGVTTVGFGAGAATVARVVGLTTTTGATIVAGFGAAVVVGLGGSMKTAAEEVAGSAGAEEAIGATGAGAELVAGTTTDEATGATDGTRDGVPAMVAVPMTTPAPVAKLPSAS